MNDEEFNNTPLGQGMKADELEQLIKEHGGAQPCRHFVHCEDCGEIVYLEAKQQV